MVSRSPRNRPLNCLSPPCAARALSSAGSTSQIERSMARGEEVSATCARSPQSSSYRMRPREYTSLRGADPLCPDLLRAGVVRRPRHGTGSFGAACRVAVQQSGDPEVQQLRDPVRGYQDIAGLQIAVNHQIGVRRFHTRAHLPEQLDARRQGELALAAEGRDGQAGYEFHREIGQPVPRPAIQKARDIGMLQSGEDLPLVPETLPQELRIAHRRCDLQRHPLGVLPVVALGFENDSHAAPPHFAQNPGRARSAVLPTPLRAVWIGPCAI